MRRDWPRNDCLIFVVGLLVWSACDRGTPLEAELYPCTRQSDCVGSYVCRPIEPLNRSICVKRGSTCTDGRDCAPNESCLSGYCLDTSLVGENNADVTRDTIDATRDTIAEPSPCPDRPSDERERCYYACNNRGVCSGIDEGDTCSAPDSWEARTEVETCDGFDNDCDGRTDEGCPLWSKTFGAKNEEDRPTDLVFDPSRDRLYLSLLRITPPTEETGLVVSYRPDDGVRNTSLMPDLANGSDERVEALEVADSSLHVGGNYRVSSNSSSNSDGWISIYQRQEQAWSARDTQFIRSSEQDGIRDIASTPDYVYAVGNTTGDIENDTTGLSSQAGFLARYSTSNSSLADFESWTSDTDTSTSLDRIVSRNGRLYLIGDATTGKLPSPPMCDHIGSIQEQWWIARLDENAQNGGLTCGWVHRLVPKSQDWSIDAMEVTSDRVYITGNKPIPQQKFTLEPFIASYDIENDGERILSRDFEVGTDGSNSDISISARDLASTRDRLYLVGQTTTQINPSEEGIQTERVQGGSDGFLATFDLTSNQLRLIDIRLVPNTNDWTALRLVTTDPKGNVYIAGQQVSQEKRAQTGSDSDSKYRDIFVLGLN